MVDISQCLAALEALHNNANQDIKKQANTFLIEFQKQREAWGVSNAILMTPNLPLTAYHFAATTLRAKMLFFFHELDKPNWLQFRDSLYHHIHKFQEGSMRAVSNQLNMSIATLVLHIAHGRDDVVPAAEESQYYWKNPLEEITNSLGTSPELAVSLLTILKYIPEECNSRNLVIEPIQKRRAMREISAFSGQLLNILKSYWDSTGDNINLKEQVYQCLHGWIKHGDLPLDTLGDNPLFQSAFDAFRIPQLVEVAADVIGEAVLQSEEMERYPRLSVFLIQKALQLMPMFDQGLVENNQELCDKIASVLIDVAECYYRGYLIQGSPEAMQILQAMLKIGKHPSKDIATHTFNFWYLFSDEINGGRVSLNAYDYDNPESSHNSHRHAQEPMIQQRKAHFREYYIYVINIVLDVGKLPEGFENCSPDDAEEGKRHRQHIPETLLDCETVLGIDVVLHTICQALEVAYQVFMQDNSKWHALESCLFAIRSIGRKVDKLENQMMPKVLDLVVSLKHSQLRYTCTLAIGRYAEWISEHRERLESVLAYVVEGFNDQKVLASASLAFKFICVGCSAHLVQKPFIDQLGQVYHAAAALPLQDRKEVIQGMAAVISVLPPDFVAQGVQQIAMPIAQHIQQLLQQNQEGDEQMCTALDCAAELFRSLKPRSNERPEAVQQACIGVLNGMWQLFDQVLQKCKQDDRRMEKLGRCWKYSMRTADVHFQGLVEHLLKTLAQYYQHTPRSAFMYTVSICIDKFGGEQYPQFKECFEACFNILVSRSLEIVNSLEKFTENPDTVEDLFEMVCRYVRKCPEFVMTSNLLPRLWEQGMPGLLLQHRVAMQSLCTFYTTIIDRGTIHQPRRGTQEAPPAATPYAPQVRKLLELYGETLCSNIYLGINGAVPEDLVKVLAGVLESILLFSREIAQHLIFKALQKIPDTYGPTKQGYLDEVLNSQPKRVILLTIRLSEACRRKDKVASIGRN